MKIDKEKLLNDLKYVFGDKEYWETLKSVVENQPECDKWISVYDRLPESLSDIIEISNYVLTAVTVKELDGEKVLHIGYRCNGKWMFAENLREDCIVTHWMPLPEPPKGD